MATSNHICACVWCVSVFVCVYMSLRVCEVLTIKCSTTSHQPIQSLKTAVLLQGLETLFRGIQAEIVDILPLQAKTGLARAQEQ